MNCNREHRKLPRSYKLPRQRAMSLVREEDEELGEGLRGSPRKELLKVKNCRIYSHPLSVEIIFYLLRRKMMNAEATELLFATEKSALF